jgi:undecaprenyl-diphosphatase
MLAAGEANRAVKVLYLAAASLLVLAIGVSRVYLGVHWPTDVVAGWAMGAVIALVATFVLHRYAPHAAPLGTRADEVPVAPEPPGGES